MQLMMRLILVIGTPQCVYTMNTTDKLKIYYDGSLVASGTTAPVNLGDTSHIDADWELIMVVLNLLVLLMNLLYGMLH